MGWRLRPDGTFENNGYSIVNDYRGRGSKVPENTKASGKRPAGTPPPKNGGRVPARQTRGKVAD